MKIISENLIICNYEKEISLFDWQNLSIVKLF